MGTAEPPSEVAEHPASKRAPEHAWRSRVLGWVSNRWAVWFWHGGLVGFFLVFVLLPTLYVLGYVVADWSGVETIFQDPLLAGRILPAITYSFGVAGMVALFDLVAGLPLAWLLVRFTGSYGEIPEGGPKDRLFVRFLAAIVAQPIMTACAFVVLYRIMGLVYHLNVPALGAVQEGI